LSAFSLLSVVDRLHTVSDLKHGWETLRERTGVSCRLHDLRHTFATRLAENGVPEFTMLALMGHMSWATLERCSHIRMAAQRDAVAGIVLWPKFSDMGENSGVAPVKVPVLEPAGLIQ
jgi:integrase